jgi:hypothetical protein
VRRHFRSLVPRTRVLVPARNNEGGQSGPPPVDGVAGKVGTGGGGGERREGEAGSGKLRVSVIAASIRAVENKEAPRKRATGGRGVIAGVREGTPSGAVCWDMMLGPRPGLRRVH